MRIYIAAPWVRREEAIAAGRVAEVAGFKVTSRWFYHEGATLDTTGSSLARAETIRQALEDIADVKRSHVLIVLNLEKSEGKAVETGIALANRIPVISVGQRSNIFQALGIEVETFAEALIVARRICDSLR